MARRRRKTEVEQKSQPCKPGKQHLFEERWRDNKANKRVSIRATCKNCHLEVWVETKPFSFKPPSEKELRSLWKVA